MYPNEKPNLGAHILYSKTSNFKKKKVFMNYVNQPETYCIANKRHLNCSILLLAAQWTLQQWETGTMKKKQKYSLHTLL